MQIENPNSRKLALAPAGDFQRGLHVLVSGETRTCRSKNLDTKNAGGGVGQLHNGARWLRLGFTKSYMQNSAASWVLHVLVSPETRTCRT